MEEISVRNLDFTTLTLFLELGPSINVYFKRIRKQTDWYWYPYWLCQNDVLKTEANVRSCNVQHGGGAFVLLSILDNSDVSFF